MTVLKVQNTFAALALFLALTAPASATYEDALSAYQKRDWPAAHVEADLLARQGHARGQDKTQ